MKFYSVDPKPHLKLRVTATAIDYSIYFTLYYIYLYIFNENPQPGKMIVTNGMVLPIVLMWFIYFVVLEYNGATPGHDIVKLKIVTMGGSRPGFSAIVKRRLLDCIDIMPYGIPALICISKSVKHQRLGDLWAGTLVVKNSDITEKEVVF